MYLYGVFPDFVFHYVLDCRELLRFFSIVVIVFLVFDDLASYCAGVLGDDCVGGLWFVYKGVSAY